MSARDLETPNIGLSLKDQATILEQGRKITRSTKREIVVSSHKAKAANHQHDHILAYHGEPTLHHYLQDTALTLQTSDSHFHNKDYKLLSYNHLPEICVLFDSWQSNRIDPTIAKLNTKKAPKNGQYIIEEFSTKNGIALSRTISKEMALLGVGQTLLFYCISYEEFKRIFAAEIEEIKKKQLSPKLDEKEESHGESREMSKRGKDSLLEGNEERIVDEHDEGMIKSSTDGPGLAQVNESIELENIEFPKLSFSSDKGSQLEIDKIQSKKNEKELISLERKLFDRLRCSEDAILWPSLVLQPLNCSRDTLTTFIHKAKLFKQKIKSINPVLKAAFQEIKEEELSFSTSAFNSSNQSSEQKKIKASNVEWDNLRRSICEKIEVKRKSETEDQETVIYLSGTKCSIAIHEDIWCNLLSWEELTREEIHQVVMKSPFRVLSEELNSFIKAFNKFKTYQDVGLKLDENRFYFNRLCKYRVAAEPFAQLCIPLRCDISHEEKKVLVRLLRENNDSLEGVLRWVEFESITANYTLPKLRQKEREILYFMGNQLSINLSLDYFYKSFQYQSFDLLKIINRLYPLQELKPNSLLTSKCIQCHYIIDNLPFFQCRFCSKYCHRQCTSRKNRYTQDRDSCLFDAFDISDTATETNEFSIWNCEECEPCTECCLPVEKNYLDCWKCKHLFHEICGKLKGVPNRSLLDMKYMCESCLKCKICQGKLKNQEYYIDEGEFFCSKCIKDYREKDYCVVCVQEEFGRWAQCDWAQCDRLNCNSWVHLRCDPFIQKETKEDIKNKKYWCPQCRTKERRRLLYHCIDQFKYFDECQFFTDPDYEELPDYSEIISGPMCLLKMKSKAIDGQYDTNTLAQITYDFQLIIHNALVYNMPKDQPHYQAKILNIMGHELLRFFKDIIELSDEQLVKKDVYDMLKNTKKDLYKHIHLNYLQILLNFKSDERSYVVVNQPNKKEEEMKSETLIFSSRYILNQIFSNPQLQFRVKKKPQKIESLFNHPKIEQSLWLPIQGNRCYYHPRQNLPIIFSCDICCESFCCTTRCIKHHTCECGQKGCSCDSFLCGCPPLRERERKPYQNKISSILLKMEKRTYTENYKYCLKCVTQNLKTQWCHYCKGYCSFNYEQCKQCHQIYHLDCEKNNRAESYWKHFGGKDELTDFKLYKLAQICFNCSCSAKNFNSFREFLMKESKRKASKFKKMYEYLPLFKFIYNENGIRLNDNDIIALLSSHEKELEERSLLLQDFRTNLELICLNYQNNQFSKEYCKSIILDSLGFAKKQLNFQFTQLEKYPSYQQEKELRKYGVLKRSFKIFLKHFHIPLPHEERLRSMNKKTLIVFQHSENLGVENYELKLNFGMKEKNENYMNNKQFEKIHSDFITMYYGPNNSKYLVYNLKKEAEKKHLIHHNAYFQHREQLIANQPEDHQWANITKEVEQYHRFSHQYGSLEIDQFHAFNFNENDKKCILADHLFTQIYDPFLQQIEPIQLATHHHFHKHYTYNKSENMQKVIKLFALRIYQESKVVLRNGSTCLLNDQPNFWRIVKNWNHLSIQFKLKKCQNNWFLSINDCTEKIESLDEMIIKIRKISPGVNSFQDLASFLGFNMVDGVFYEPNHFTHLLQTTPLDSLSKRQRKAKVKSKFEKYCWGNQGTFFNLGHEEENVKQYDFNVTKQPLFLLNRKKSSLQEEESDVVKKPYISFEDIKRDLDDPISLIAKVEAIHLKDHHSEVVYIAPSKIDKLGLFIRRQVKKNNVAIEYVGEIISEAVADLRQAKFHFGCYMFGLGRRNLQRTEIIDATYVGNMARYLNHSCDPNCKAKIEIINHQPRIYIYTIRDVQENEELTYDYQFKIDKNQKLVCTCKAKNCQGRLN